jgi:predicted transposase YbfD/YdcC
MKNVYKIDDGLRLLTDGRINPTYQTGHVVSLPLFGFLLRIRSFNELSSMIKGNEFQKLYQRGCKFPRIDTIRDTLKVLDLCRLQEMNKKVVNKAFRNKVFNEGTISGHRVVAIDGTKFFGSNKKSCDKCLKNSNHHYHSGAVISLIGDAPRLVVDFEMINPSKDSSIKDEGELTASKRLISRVSKELKGKIDVVVYDALACNSIWINHLLDLNIDTVVRVKKNNNNSLREAKKILNKSEPVEVWNLERQKCIKVYESMFKMSNVKEPLRLVKFKVKNSDGSRSQIIMTTLKRASLKTLYKMIKARWNIENSIFNNMKAQYHLDHCFVHGGNAVEAVIGLLFIAHNITQLFLEKRIRKQIKSQRELIRLLWKGLYLLKNSSEIVFNSS